MARVSALPLADDGSARFLPWIIGLMVYLAALAIGGAFALDDALARWDGGLRGALTIELPRPPTGGALPQDKLDEALRLVRATSGVATAEPLDAKAQAALLRPWLGDDADLLLLPVPALVDVRLVPGATLDEPSLLDRLRAVAPGATVEGHGAWLDRLLGIARLIEAVGLVVVALIGVAAVVTVVFATRTGLALHAAVIDLLHLIGAPDRFVAEQFERHAFRLGVRGGVIGLVLALLSFGALRLTAEGGAATADLMPGFHLPIIAWLVVLALPLVMGLVGLVTARLTVLRALARMP